MRGRTNATGDNLKINGKFEIYEIAPGEVINRGDFVQFTAKAKVLKETSYNTSQRYAQKFKISEGKYLLYYYTSSSSYILNLVSLKNGYEILDSYVLGGLSTRAMNIVELNGYFYYYNLSSKLLSKIKIENDKIVLEKESKILLDLFPIGGAAYGDKIVYIAMDSGSGTYIPWKAYFFNEDLENESVDDFTSLKYTTIDSCGVISKVINDRLLYMFNSGTFGVCTYSSLIQGIDVGNFPSGGEYEVMYTNSYNEVYVYKMMCGMEEMINEGYIFIPYTGSGGLGVALYKIDSGFNMVSSVLLPNRQSGANNINDYYYINCGIGKVGDNLILISRLYNTNEKVAVQGTAGSTQNPKTICFTLVEVDEITKGMSVVDEYYFYPKDIIEVDYKLAFGTGTSPSIIMGYNGNIYCLVNISCVSGYTQYNGLYLISFEVINNELAFRSSKQIKKYSNGYGIGLANQYGIAGQFIGVYVPN